MKKQLSIIKPKLTTGTVGYVSKVYLNSKIGHLIKMFPKNKEEIVENTEKFILKVGVRGNDLEKGMLARLLSIVDTFSLRPISYFSEKYNTESKFCDMLSAEISKLSESYGHKFNSDVQIMAYDVLSDYGGLSMLDFILFFQMARKGKFISPEQRISTRGVTREYLISWLNLYCDEKETVNLSLHKISKDEDVSKVSKIKKELIHKMNEVNKRNKIYDLKSKKISTLEGYIYFHFCYPYGLGIDNAKKTILNIKSRIKSMYDMKTAGEKEVVNYDQYEEIILGRYLFRIKELVKINLIDYMYSILNSAYSLDELNERFKLNLIEFTKYSISKAIMRSTKNKDSLYDTLNKEWINYASKKENPMNKKQWIFIKIKYYFMKGLDKKHDILYDRYLKTIVNG